MRNYRSECGIDAGKLYGFLVANDPSSTVPEAEEIVRIGEKEYRVKKAERVGDSEFNYYYPHIFIQVYR